MFLLPSLTLVEFLRCLYCSIISTGTWSWKKLNSLVAIGKIEWEHEHELLKFGSKDSLLGLHASATGIFFYHSQQWTSISLFEAVSYVRCKSQSMSRRQKINSSSEMMFKLMSLESAESLVTSWWKSTIASFSLMFSVFWKRTFKNHCVLHEETFCISLQDWHVAIFPFDFQWF